MSRRRETGSPNNVDTVLLLCIPSQQVFRLVSRILCIRQLWQGMPFSVMTRDAFRRIMTWLGAAWTKRRRSLGGVWQTRLVSLRLRCSSRTLILPGSLTLARWILPGSLTLTLARLMVVTLARLMVVALSITLLLLIARLGGATITGVVAPKRIIATRRSVWRTACLLVA